MTLHKLLLFILGLLFLGSNYAQDKYIEPSLDFSLINDTIAYNKVLDDLLKIVNERSRELTIEEIDKIIEIGVNLDYTKGLGKINVLKARVYKDRLEYSKSIKYYKKAIFYFKKINYERDIARAHNQLYIVESRIGNLEKGAYYLLESKNYFEKVFDSISLIVIYNNLGSVHMALSDLDTSEDSYLKAISLKNNSGQLQGIGDIMNNLAYVYIEKKQYDEAEKMAQEAIDANRKDNIADVMGFSYSIFGEITLARKEFVKSKKYYDSAYYFYNKANDNFMVIDTKQRLGFVEYKLGNNQKASELYAIARDSFISIDSKDKLLINYELSSKLDSARGNLAGALAWQHKYQQLSDRLASDLSSKKIEKKEEFYEKELAQLRTIDAQEIREERNKEELFRYRILTYIILGVLLISLLFALWIMQTRKERKQLITKLDKSNQVKHKLFSIISHDLKNEIHGLESSLNLMQDNELSTEEFEEIVPLLADRTNQTSILLNNLLSWSKSQMKELRANPVSFDVSEVILDKFIFFKPKAHQKNITLINKLDSTNVYADRDMVAIVAQNLIANAIKFCQAGDSITLLSIEKKECYEIGFADTGLGIDPANLSKLFAEETFTTHGTQNESGTGLGLRICRELIELNKGNIRVESTLGAGSTFFITLPKSIT